jgi:hypothetical protein
MVIEGLLPHQQEGLVTGREEVRKRIELRTPKPDSGIRDQKRNLTKRPIASQPASQPYDGVWRQLRKEEDRWREIQSD